MLTPKQSLFVQEYLVDLNAAAAARRAGYSAHTADRMGYENLRKPEIAAAISAAQAARSERTQITADDVIRGLKTEAEYHGDGTSHGARVSAWAHLGKHLGLFVERQEHTGSVRMEIIEEITDGGSPEKANPPSSGPSGVPPE